MSCIANVGQTPWSAAGPLAGFLRQSTKADGGVAADQGVRPTKGGAITGE